MTIIGRKAEIQKLDDYYYSGRPELLIVYGRRRVGKTYLVKEHFRNSFTFYFTGKINSRMKDNLHNFDKAIIEHGGEDSKPSKNWSDAFDKLKYLLKKSSGERKVIFIDEMPWLDTKKSGFLSAFDYFWNSFASSNSDILFIGCGSATSWITKRIFNNKGGLHNRVTGRLYLAPFTVGECEEFFKTRGIEINRHSLAECYMVFGGIPYYLNLFNRGLSFEQNVDALCFSKNAPMKNEFKELYMSLFNNPHQHIVIIEALSSKLSGLTRSELTKTTGIQSNGQLTLVLNELQQNDFIDMYGDTSKQKNGAYYFITDPFTLFYLRYMKDNIIKDEHFWTGKTDEGGRFAWRGYAFELLCRLHLRQIKKALGISGVSAAISSWRSKDTKPGAQIDLVIRRKDGITNLCEMKYTKQPFVIDRPYCDVLINKRSVFYAETDSKQTVHLTMITTHGIARTGYFSTVQSEVILDDLFE